MLNNTRSSNGSMNDFIPRSSRSDTHMSELSVGEVMRRLREKSDATKNVADMKDIEALGEYNALSDQSIQNDVVVRVFRLYQVK